MKSNKIKIAAPMCLILVACTPLRQAPLVYVSDHSYGLNVVIGQPSEPGVKLTAGVDLKDAAYVPVAVGRDCEDIPLNEITSEPAKTSSTDTSDGMRKQTEKKSDVTCWSNFGPRDP